MHTEYLESTLKQFDYYKMLAEKTFVQLSDEQLFWRYNETSNSIAIIVKHLSGNMLSRWTDFLNSDGEKEWRKRDAEFENDWTTRQQMLDYWNKGWTVFLNTLGSLKPEDLDKIVYIRNQGHTVLEAINRQLAHYPYHIGQIVLIGKMCNEQFQTLSIAKGQSDTFNAQKFARAKERGHFTDDFLKQDKPL